MKNKTLNLLILALLACFASIGLTTLSIFMKSNDLVHLDLIMLLLSTITDVACMMLVYFAVKSAFSTKSDLSIWVGGLSAFVFIVFWTAFKNYVFKGVFDLYLAFDDLYLSLFAHLFDEVIHSIVVYFGVTLFAATDVVNQMGIFTIKLLTMTIGLVFIPILPGLLIFNDLLRGNEEYRFTKEEQEDFDELKL